MCVRFGFNGICYLLWLGRVDWFVVDIVVYWIGWNWCIGCVGNFVVG